MKLTPARLRAIENYIYSYPTKYKEGFLKEEIKLLLKPYAEINMAKFNDALMGNTCMLMENKTIRYHTDIYKAVVCSLEGRDLNSAEWD